MLKELMNGKQHEQLVCCVAMFTHFSFDLICMKDLHERLSSPLSTKSKAILHTDNELASPVLHRAGALAPLRELVQGHLLRMRTCGVCVFVQWLVGRLAVADLAPLPLGGRPAVAWQRHSVLGWLQRVFVFHHWSAACGVGA